MTSVSNNYGHFKLGISFNLGKCYSRTKIEKKYYFLPYVISKQGFERSVYLHIYTYVRTYIYILYTYYMYGRYIYMDG